MTTPSTAPLQRSSFSSLLLITALAVVWGFMVFGHDLIGRTLAESWDINARDAFNARFSVIGAVMGLSFLATWGFAAWKSNAHTARKTAYLALTITLALVAFRYLLVVNSEIMHFPQYALVALLLFALIGNFPEALFFTILLGIIDEAYQFFILAPEKTSYLDFNDMWLNGIGGAFGLLLAGSLLPGRIRPKRNYLALRGPICISILIVAAIVIGLFLTGFLGYQYSPESSAKYFVMRQPVKNFWSAADFNVTYHIVHPLEGLIGIAAIWGIYLPMERSFLTEVRHDGSLS